MPAFNFASLPLPYCRVAWLECSAAGFAPEVVNCAEHLYDHNYDVKFALEFILEDKVLLYKA